MARKQLGKARRRVYGRSGPIALTGRVESSLWRAGCFGHCCSIELTSGRVTLPGVAVSGEILCSSMLTHSSQTSVQPRCYSATLL
jgi:hypothetical protein